MQESSNIISEKWFILCSFFYGFILSSSLDMLAIRSCFILHLYFCFKFQILPIYNFRTWCLLQTISKNARNSKKWVHENIMNWSELLASPLHCILMNAEDTTVMHCCRIMSYLYLYVAQQIYKPPSECNFNRSPFVRFCKLILQNVVSSIDFGKCSSLSLNPLNFETELKWILKISTSSNGS